MANELRGILKNLMIGKQLQGSIGDIETREETQRIDQNTAEIKSLLTSKLPSKNFIPKPNEIDGEYNRDFALGFNQALTEIEKIVEEL